MKLLKVIVVIFLIYFIRRFIQMYKVMKQIQNEHAQKKEEPKSHVVEAEYTVVD